MFRTVHIGRLIGCTGLPFRHFSIWPGHQTERNTFTCLGSRRVHYQLTSCAFLVTNNRGADDQSVSGHLSGYVAIVDDDDSVRRATARLISAHSFPVRCYASAHEFLESQDGVPACLIVDLRMSGMTGLELLHSLNGTGSMFPVIVMTADDAPGLRHRCELAGASSFLNKPVPAEMLLNAINAATTARDRIAAG